MDTDLHARHPVFSSEHLATIQKALDDDAAYAALCSRLERLTAIVQEAKARGCTEFACSVALGGSYVLQLKFGNYEGKRYKASLSFAAAYIRAGGENYGFEVGMALKEAVESLVLGVEGIGALRRIVSGRKVSEVA
jgi:hypothetical protein